MNQIFIGGIALIITFILWSSQKKSKGMLFLRSQNDTFHNRSETSSLVQKKRLINQEVQGSIKKLIPKPFFNRTSLNPIETKKKLTKLISSSPDDRLLAIQIASKWRNKKAIPFLRRGLKDSDRRVVIASAIGIATYKGKINDLQKKHQTSRPPRNVSLMR